MIDRQAIRRRLEERRDQLIARTRRIQGDLRRLRHPDSEERVTEGQNDEVLEGLDDVERAELARVTHALDRLDAATYEQCERCGQLIAADRLEALPETAVCMSCA